ncbi:MAG: hypothetical protein IJS47_06020 [Clostridia bacterium]|nr:hypothetical protein [Clostridia bacterium]
MKKIISLLMVVIIGMFTMAPAMATTLNFNKKLETNSKITIKLDQDLKAKKIIRSKIVKPIENPIPVPKPIKPILVEK